MIKPNKISLKIKKSFSIYMQYIPSDRTIPSDRAIANPHLLDFTTNDNVTIPEWFNPEIKSLHSGGPDTHNFRILDNDYNVYYCYPSSVHYSNPITGFYYINTTMRLISDQYNHKILVCIIDMDDQDQLVRFKTLFNNYFDKIEIGHHSHIIKIEDAEQILNDEGIYIRTEKSHILTLDNIRAISQLKFNGIESISSHIDSSPERFTIFKRLNIVNTESPELHTLKIQIIENILNMIDSYAFIKFKVLGIFTLLEVETIKISTVYYVYKFLLSRFVLSIPDYIYVYLDITDPDNIKSYFKKRYIEIEDAIADYYLKTPTDHNKKYLKYKNKYLELKNNKF